MTTAVAARAAIVVAALLFSTGGAAIKGSELSAMQVSGARSGIAALVLALAVAPGRRRLPPRVWGVGVGYALVVTLFVIGNKLTTSAHTTSTCNPRRHSSSWRSRRGWSVPAPCDATSWEPVPC